MIKGILFDLNGVLLYNGSEGVAFFKENISILPKLAQNHKLAVVSNAPSRYREELKKEGLLNYFYAVVLSEEIGFSKPEIEFFEIALSKIGLKPEEVLFIDDNYDNIISAKKLGIKCIHCENNDQLREQLNAVGVVV